jgi:hypothetical protein
LAKFPTAVQVAPATSRDQDIEVIAPNAMLAQNGKRPFSRADISQYLLGA